MAGTLHTFQDQSYGIGHVTGPNVMDCPCKPKRKTKMVKQLTGKWGNTYGYRTEVTVEHHVLTH